MNPLTSEPPCLTIWLQELCDNLILYIVLPGMCNCWVQERHRTQLLGWFGVVAVGAVSHKLGSILDVSRRDRKLRCGTGVAPCAAESGTWGLQGSSIDFGLQDSTGVAILLGQAAR